MQFARALWQQLQRRGDRPIVALIVTLAIVLRWRALGGDYYGDEAWYMYLARTWGADANAVVGGQNPVAHLLYRPIFYLLYHFPAHAGLTTCRALTSAIGVATVPLTCALARRFGASRSFVYIAGLVVACHPNLVRFNTLVFPDTLASAFLVSAALLYERRQHLWAPFFIILAVLTKESTSAYTFAFCFMAWRRRDGWLRSAAYLLPLLYVATSVFIAVRLLGSPHQGWATRPLGVDVLRNMLAGPELLPFALALVAFRRWEPLIFWGTSPLFYAVWSWGFGRGVSFWYAVPPAPVAAAAISVGVESAWQWLSTRGAIAAWLATHRSKISRFTPIVAAAVAVALAPTAWEHFRRLDGARRGKTLTAATSIVQQRAPRDITFINCHFALAYEPLRTSESRSFITYTDKAEATPSPSTDLAVWCKEGQSPGPPQRFAGCTLLYANHLAVYSREPCNDR